MKQMKVFLTSLIPLLSLNSAPLIHQNYQRGWDPDWVEKLITVDEFYQGDAKKEGHDKWHLNLSREHLNLPENYNSIEVTGISITYGLNFWFVTKWYDGKTYNANQDGLEEATEVFENRHNFHAALNFWVEGWKQSSGSVLIETGVVGAPSISSSQSYGALVAGYDLASFSVSMNYRYSLSNKDNQKLEKDVFGFLDNWHDLGLTNLNRQKDINIVLTRELKNALPVKLRDHVAIKVKDSENNGLKYLENEREEIPVVATIFGKKFTKDYIKNTDLKIKLETIQQRPQNLRQIIDALENDQWSIDINEIDYRYKDLTHNQLLYHVNNFLPEWVKLKNLITFENTDQDLSSYRQVINEHFVTHIVHNKDGYSMRLSTKNHHNNPVLIGEIQFYQS